MGETARTLTFGDDASVCADTAWGWVTAHTWPGWRVEVVTVRIPPMRSVASPLGFTELHAWKPAAPRVAPASCGLAGVAHLVADHDPRLVLGSTVDSDLLVIGPRGQGVLKSLHVGSTAEWLMRCPSAPLVVARRAMLTHEVLACVDGSGHARASVEVLAGLPWVSGARVSVLGVVQSGDDAATRAVDEATGRLRAAGATVRPMVVVPDPLALTVNPVAAVFEAIDLVSPDLVVLGTSGRTGLARLWLGSVASSVARHADCSVLLVRDPHGGDGDGDQ